MSWYEVAGSVQHAPSTHPPPRSCGVSISRLGFQMESWHQPFSLIRFSTKRLMTTRGHHCPVM